MRGCKNDILKYLMIVTDKVDEIAMIRYEMLKKQQRSDSLSLFQTRHMHAKKHKKLFT